MDTQPKIPTLKDSQKPQVKVRGLQAGVTLLERLKQFKKKDLAFILAGLGTLFMAPLAEHFMMSPESGDGTLQAGWKGGKGGMFDGSGSSPYEPGTSGLAPGSAVGGGSDIITPLNVRDPSALVMGPGAAQQPPTNSVMPGTPPATAPATHSDSELKDALAASARGVGTAAKRALLPMPKIALGGSGLRGLGVVNGGSSASAGGGPPSSAGLVSGKASTGGGLSRVQPLPGFKNVARGQSSGDSNGYDAMRKAADAAAGEFNRGGAASGLNAAANTGIPGGAGGAFGGKGGGVGANDKADGGNSTKDSKSVGESLAFLKAKAIQEAEIDLWKKEQEAGDSKLELLKMRNTMAETIAGGMATNINTELGCIFGTSASKDCPSAGGVTMYVCPNPKAGGGLIPVKAGTVGKVYSDCRDTPADGKGAGASNGKDYYTTDGSNLTSCKEGDHPSLFGCWSDGKTDGGGNGTAPPGTNQTNPIGSGGTSGIYSGIGYLPANAMGTDCNNLNDIAGKLDPTSPTSGKITDFLGIAAKVVVARDAIENVYHDPTKLSGGCDPKHSQTALSLTGGKTLVDQLAFIVGHQQGATTPDGPLMQPRDGDGTLTNIEALIQAGKSDDTTKTLTQIAQQVNGPAGIVADVQKFSADIETVKTQWTGLTAQLAAAATQIQVSQADAQKELGASGGVHTLQGQIDLYTGDIGKGAGVVDKVLQGMDNAKTSLLKTVVPDLQAVAGQSGTDGTIGTIVTRNQDLVDVFQQAKDAKVDVSNVKPPTAPDAKGVSANIGSLQEILGIGGASGDQVHEAIQKAAAAITAAQKNPDKVSAAQQALSEAVGFIQTIQNRQSAVDGVSKDSVAGDSIGATATAAAQLEATGAPPTGGGSGGAK